MAKRVKSFRAWCSNFVHGNHTYSDLARDIYADTCWPSFARTEASGSFQAAQDHIINSHYALVVGNEYAIEMLERMWKSYQAYRHNRLRAVKD